MSKSNALSKLEGPFVAIARTRAKEWDLEVVDGGTKISTNGKRIFIPFRLGEIESIPVQVLHGYLDHETGHVIEENRHKSVGRETPLQIMARLSGANLRFMMNVFEDIRMERVQGDEYPGVADNLNAAADYSVQKMLSKRPKDFWANIGGAIICHVSGRTLEWMEPAFAPYLEAIHEEMDQAADRDLLVWGQDSERLARAVVAKLKEVAEEESKPTPPSPPTAGKDEPEDGQSDEDGDDSASAPSDSGDSGESAEDEDGDDGAGSEAEDANEDGENEDESGAEDGDSDEDGDGGDEDSGSAGGDSSDGDSDEDGDGDGSDGEGEGASASAEGDGSDGEGEGGAASEGARDDESKPTDEERKDMARRASETTSTEHMMDVVGEDIEKECKRVDADKYTAPVDRSKDVWRKPTADGSVSYDELAASASSATGALRNKLRVVLQARSECRRISDQVRGELDSSALHTLRLGGKRIFSHEVKGEKLDVSVSILIDQSGSMGESRHRGSPAAMARLAAIALGQALDAVGIPFEVMGFTNTYPERGVTVLPCPNGRDYRAPFVFDIFKAFGESFRDTKNRFTAISGCADNADGEAVWECAKRLAARPSERRVLIVLSDGIPMCNGIPMKAGADYLREVVKRITSSGIEVIGVGIMHDQVQDFYNERTGAKWVNVRTLADLPVVVVKALSESLLTRRAKS